MGMRMQTIRKKPPSSSASSAKKGSTKRKNKDSDSDCLEEDEDEGSDEFDDVHDLKKKMEARKGNDMICSQTTLKEILKNSDAF